MSQTISNDEVTAQAVFVHQAFQRAKPHDYHKPFEESNTEYQRVMKSIATELLAQKDAEVQKARAEVYEKLTDQLYGMNLNITMAEQQNMFRELDYVYKKLHHPELD